ncbi:MAG: RAMP superfamily CRISPR-associated protein [Blastocatellia bacterium]
MARKLDARWLFSGQLVAETPLSVGGLGGNVDADLALAVNGQGQFYIPGTSLAGPLRAWLCARVGKEAVKKLWGFQEGDQGHASFVFVEDGLVLDQNNQPLDLRCGEIRDGVGIDRYSGAAADKAKYNRQVLPRGARIDFQMTVELTNEKQPEAKRLLAALWQALRAGEIRFGSSKTRGLGRVRLQQAQTRQQEFSHRAGLLKVLADEAEPLTLPEENPYEQPRLTFELHWQPVGPLMVKAEADGVAVDMLPLMSAVDDKLALVLPGSSVKGALRNQAERIVRTLKGLAVNADDFHAQINADELSLIHGLFGQAAKAETKKSTSREAKSNKQRLELCPENFVPVPGLGALSVDDCYAVPQVQCEAWAAIAGATDEQTLRTALNATPLKTAQQAFHVAIDRWLGGAADNLLYTVLEPHGIAWEPLRLTLDLQRLPEGQRDAAVTCLLLVLRDFVAGRIPLGYGTNRGMGAVAVTNIQVRSKKLDDKLANLTLRVAGQKLVIGDDAAREHLHQQWRTWIASHQSEAV